MSEILSSIYSVGFDDKVRLLHPFPNDSGVKSLYKYFGSTEYIDDLFDNLNIHHSAPEEFNDPFECKVLIDRSLPNSAANIRQHLYKVCRMAGHTRKEASQLVSKSMREENFIDVNLLYSLNEAYAGLKISSFTTDIENLLMWSHYGQSHSGFCVEFSTSYFPFNMAYKVTYSSGYTIVNYPLKGTYEQLRIALEKSDSWAYEDEYRTLIVPGTNFLPTDGRVYNFEAAAVNAVYLGVNISLEDRDKIINKIRNSKIQCDIYQAALKPRDYGIVFNKMF